MKIVVKYEHPPVPYRSDDFSAIDSDTYESGQPVGRGATEQEAVEDLKTQMEERAPVRSAGGK